MVTYSVKQIAEMLDTNPETVRRWIREKKLKAIQVSKKDGSKITESDLKKFLDATPKYLSRATARLASSNPALGIATIAGTALASAVIACLSEKKNGTDVRVMPRDLKEYLVENVAKCRDLISQKRALIDQINKEIASLEKQIEQQEYLIEHDELIEKVIGKT